MTIKTATKLRNASGPLQTGLEKLRTGGVPIDDASPALVAVLDRHIGKDRDADLAIIFLLGKIADPAAADALAALESRVAGKEAKKEIRRSLYRLAQKGIRPAESKSAEESPRRALLAMGARIEGYLSSVDGGGGRLVWLAKPEAGSGMQLLQGAVSDRDGLVRFGGVRVRRKELRHMAEDIKEKHGVAMISIPWEYADRILYEAYQKTERLQGGGTEDFLSLRAVFTSAKPKDSPHPVYSRLSLSDVRTGAWRELSRRLLDEGEFGLWILDEDWLKPYLEQMQEAQQSRLVLNEIQKEERLAAVVRDAVREIFAGERGLIFQRRMEDMALYLLETKRDEQARLALAVAQQLAEGSPGPLDISFLTGLVQKSLAFYLSRIKEKAAEESPLIVKP
jgi:hypothetical protein